MGKRLNRTLLNWRWWVAIAPMLIFIAALGVSVVLRVFSEAIAAFEEGAYQKLNRWVKAGVKA